MGSAIAQHTDCGININALPGFEIRVASTKACTSQIVAMTIMALVLSEELRAKAAMTEQIVASLEALPDVIRGHNVLMRRMAIVCRCHCIA